MGRRNTNGIKRYPRRAALVSGSLVIDTLFKSGVRVRDQVVVDHGIPGRQNLMFAASTREQYFGGCAGNMCYGLSLLKTPCFLVGGVGKDRASYVKHLSRKNITQRLYIDESGYTSSFFGLSDEEGGQIGLFDPGCYHKILKHFSITRALQVKDWQKIDVAIFAPGTAQSIARDAQAFREKRKEATIIIDPGQMLAVDFSRALLERAIKAGDILIMNDNEAHFMKTKLGITQEMLWRWGLRYFIVTEGDKGSTLHTKEGVEHVRAQKVARVVDPTGAGDAFRVGLIHTLLRGGSVLEGMRVGARLGAKCVMKKGGQTYSLKK